MIQQRSFYDPYGSQQAQGNTYSSITGGAASFSAVGGAMSLATGFGAQALGATALAGTLGGIGIVALGVVAPVLGAAALIAKGGEFAGKAVSEVARFGRMARRTEFATRYVDTRAAYTMRQQAMRFMHDSAYSIRATLGRESQLFHA